MTNNLKSIDIFFYLPTYYDCLLQIVTLQQGYDQPTDIIDTEVDAWLKDPDLQFSEAGFLINPPSEFATKGDIRHRHNGYTTIMLPRISPDAITRACIVRQALMDRLPLLLGDDSLEEAVDKLLIRDEQMQLRLERWKQSGHLG